MTLRIGRNRLTKDLLRDFLRELYMQHFSDEPAPAKSAERAVTQKEVAQWLHEQGTVAADPEMQPLKKLALINAALADELDELGLRKFFTEARSNRITTSLLIIVVNTDADTYHAGLRERVITYLCKMAEIPPDDDRDDVRKAVNSIDKALLRLRFGDIDAYMVQATLVFHLGWLAHSQGVAHPQLIANLPAIETQLWGLISPYHVET